MKIHPVPTLSMRRQLSLFLCLFTLLWSVDPLPILIGIDGSATAYASTHDQRPRNKRSRRTPRTRPKPPEPPSIKFDSVDVKILADGVEYRRIRTVGDHIAHVLVVDRTRQAGLRTWKALDRHDGLERVDDIFLRADSLLADTVLGAVNGSFWRAGSTTPIGPTVTDGRVVETAIYKSWSSLLIFEDGSATIDRVKLAGELHWRGRTFDIESVNRRSDHEGVVLYNLYYGDSIPRGSRRTDSAIVAEAVENAVDASTDDTEGTLDTAALIAEYRTAKVQEDAEHAQIKLVCVPVRPRNPRLPLPDPMIGDTLSYVVTVVDTGVVEIPEDGCVVSTGIAAEYLAFVPEGDTVRIAHRIVPNQKKRIREVITGTPRLVRKGKADPEYETEGSRARRFVRSWLSRTAVGISKDQDTLYLVSIERADRDLGTHGMSLEILADFMRNLGAYDAMNFDGGGSSSMTVGGITVGTQGRRRVSNAIVAVKNAPKEPVHRRPPVRRMWEN